MVDFIVKNIVDSAFELIGVKSTDAALPPYQETKGVEVLNDRLASYSNSSAKVPYCQELRFDTVPNQQDYELGVGYPINTPKIIRLDYVNLKTHGTAEIPLIPIDRESWYNNARSSTNVAQPCYYYINQELDLSKIRFLPIPNAVYEILILAKFEIPPVTVLTDLSAYLPKNWQEFVKYDVANSLYSLYPTEFWDASKKSKYKELKTEAQSASDNTIYPSYNGTLTASTGGWSYYNGKRFI